MIVVTLQIMMVYVKAACVTQLSDALITQLNIFTYIDGVSEKCIPCLSTDVKILLGK